MHKNMRDTKLFSLKKHFKEKNYLIYLWPLFTNKKILKGTLKFKLALFLLEGKILKTEKLKCY